MFIKWLGKYIDGGVKRMRITVKLSTCKCDLNKVKGAFLEVWYEWQRYKATMLCRYKD